MGQILQSTQITQFEVQRVNDKPAINRDAYENGPQESHSYVVFKVQVVDNAEEQGSQKSEYRKDSKYIKPRDHFLLILLSQSSY